MKLYIYIQNPEDFLKGDYGLSMNISSYEPKYVAQVWKDWIPAGEVEVEIEVEDTTIRQKAKAQLDTEICATRELFTGKMNTLERRMQELLCLTHQPVDEQ